MRPIWNKRGSDSSCKISSKDGYSDQDNGWGEHEFQSNPVGKRQRREKLNYIELANSKLSLSSTFKRYNILFDISYSTSGWTHKCACPFPDHTERTPSFGYNPEADRFNCFGCQRGGRSIQFISYMEDTPQIAVAKNLMGHLISFEDGNENDDYGYEDRRKVQASLFEFADCLRLFKKDNGFNEASDYADSVGWHLDVYLRKHAQNGSVLPDDLAARIQKIKEYLKAFGDPDE